MKRTLSILAASVAALTLNACSSGAEEPTEQIVVREPGQDSAPVQDDAGAADTLIAVGEAAFATCSACHSAEKGAPSAIGPNLYGIVGRPAGSADGYRYSNAMKSSGIVWTESELDRFITNPSVAVRGTTMSAGAVSNAERRASIIAYLASLSE